MTNRLQADTTSWTPKDSSVLASSVCALSSARTSRGMLSGSLRSARLTMDWDSTVSGLTQLTVSPAPSNSSLS